MTDQITIPRALLEQAMNMIPPTTVKKIALKKAIRAELAKPVEPVEPAAWRTFDGEGGYMFRAYEDNEDYQEWWEKRNPHHKGWVEPLYLHPPTPAWHDAPEVAALKAERDAAMKDAERMKEGLDAVEVLIDNSSGVAGLHLNGDLALWSDLRTGGHFEAWLLAFDEAIDAAMKGTP